MKYLPSDADPPPSNSSSELQYLTPKTSCGGKSYKRASSPLSFRNIPVRMHLFLQCRPPGGSGGGAGGGAGGAGGAGQSTSDSPPLLSPSLSGRHAVPPPVV